MRYQNIDNLDAGLEAIVSETVKHYYTDWKNYDRPKYMCLKGSKDRLDREFYLIVRACGTWIVTKRDYLERECMRTVFDYYRDQERSTYYRVDLDSKVIVKVNDWDRQKKSLENDRKYYKTA